MINLLIDFTTFVALISESVNSMWHKIRDKRNTILRIRRDTMELALFWFWDQSTRNAAKSHQSLFFSSVQYLPCLDFFFLNPFLCKHVYAFL